jgi:hypothetical protein
MAPSSDDDVSAGSILRDLIFNQYQAIVLGGAALVSLVALNPLPLLIWVGSELVLLPILDSGPLRRLVSRRKREIARAKASAGRSRVIADLSAPHAKRFAAMEQVCGLIEANYQSLSGISQAYLSEQRGKLDLILNGSLHRLHALQRYQRMPARRGAGDLEREIAGLEQELTRDGVPPRAAAAIEKNLELKRRLLASIAQVGDTIRTLQAEIDSMESLVEVLHQNSLSLRDPQAIADELDTIVRQSEDSERVVREMEALLRDDTGGWSADLAVTATDLPPVPIEPAATTTTPRQKVKGR